MGALLLTTAVPSAGGIVDSKVLLCVDLSNQMYKACAAHPILKSNGVHTGGLYGFMAAIAKAIGEVNATSIVLCVDSKPYHRTKFYKDYKQLRADNKDPILVDNVITTERLLRDMMKVLGWPIWEVAGFESDDLIGHATIHYRHRFDKVVGMSNDSDLYQLFQYPNYLQYKGKHGIFTKDDFFMEWGIHPKQLVKALAMTGTHNEVAGIDGIGKVRARNLLLNKPKEYRELRENCKFIIERNEGLITLPHKDFPIEQQLPRYTCNYDERALIRFCSRYEINLQRWWSEHFEKVAHHV